jgi:hypothetical protein
MDNKTQLYRPGEHEAVSRANLGPHKLMLENDNTGLTKMEIHYGFSDPADRLRIFISPVLGGSLSFPMHLEQAVYVRNFLNEYIENIARIALKPEKTQDEIDRENAAKDWAQPPGSGG